MDRLASVQRGNVFERLGQRVVLTETLLTASVRGGYSRLRFVADLAQLSALSALAALGIHNIASVHNANVEIAKLATQQQHFEELATTMQTPVDRAIMEGNALSLEGNIKDLKKQLPGPVGVGVDVLLAGAGSVLATSRGIRIARKAIYPSK